MAFLLGDALLRAGLRETLLLAPWLLLLLWGVYVGVFTSHVTTDADGVTVQNFLRRTHLTWTAVTDIDLVYQLVIKSTEGRRISCYGGPVNGRPARAAQRARDGRGDASLQDLDRIRDDWETGRAAGGPPVTTRSWDLPAIIAFLVLAAGAVVASIIVVP